MHRIIAALDDEPFLRISALMHETVGLSLPPAKKALIYTRLVARIQRLGLAGFDEYCSLIEGPDDDGEFQVAVDLLTTNETYFFREPAHFDLLEREVSQAPSRALTVWSAASSFGDEAYSTAMLLADMQQQGRLAAPWSVLGTDISDRVLHSAVTAIYPAERLRHVSQARMKRYTLRGEGESDGLVQIVPALREKVRFGQLNLMLPLDSGLGPFDVIFLRNVLIYFDPATKSEVADRVLGLLRPGGLFFIGMAEGRIPCRTKLQTLGPGAFRKTH